MSVCRPIFGARKSFQENICNLGAELEIQKLYIYAVILCFVFLGERTFESFLSKSKVFVDCVQDVFIWRISTI